MSPAGSPSDRLTGALRTHAGARLGMALVAGWAVAEATFWFVAPDFLLGLLCAFVPLAWRRLPLVALAGSAAGGLLCWWLNVAHPEAMGRILQATPFVTPRMIETIDGLYGRHGHAAVFVQSLSFMQFKIWTHLAVRHGFDPWLYIAIVMLSRAARFYAVAWIASRIGRRFGEALGRHSIAVTLAYALAFWVMLMVIEGH